MAGRKAPENESPADRFKRLANIRWGAAAKAIDNLANLVGNQYASTPEQHDKLFGDLRGRLDNAAKALKANKAPSKATGGIL